MFWFKLNKLRQIIYEPIFIRALVKGAVAGVEHRCLLQNLKCDFIVDVGANRGQFAPAILSMNKSNEVNNKKTQKSGRQKHPKCSMRMRRYLLCVPIF